MKLLGRTPPPRGWCVIWIPGTHRWAAAKDGVIQGTYRTEAEAATVVRSHGGDPHADVSFGGYRPIKDEE